MHIPGFFHWWQLVLLCIIVLCFLLWNTVQRHQTKRITNQRRIEKQKACRRVDSGDTIFVSVASYRDPECPNTVFDCLEKASCPLRVFVGVCEQNYPRDGNVLQGYSRLAKQQGSGNYIDQIRVLQIEAGQAQGPMYARSMIEQNLYRGERYYLIVDSHMLFTPQWDTRLITMLKQCPSEKLVSTMYPADFQHRPPLKPLPQKGSKNKKTQPPAFLRFKQFNPKTGLPEIEGPCCKYSPSEPLPSLFWGGCFSFGEATMIHEVPYDPYCPYVFMGEEISMAVRLYTSGWDLYTPTDMVVRHMWVRRRPTFWEQFTGDTKPHRHRQKLEQRGYRRLRNVFGLQTLQPGDPELGHMVLRVLFVNYQIMNSTVELTFYYSQWLLTQN